MCRSPSIGHVPLVLRQRGIRPRMDAQHAGQPDGDVMRQLVRRLRVAAEHRLLLDRAFEHRRDVIGIEQVEHALRRAGLLDRLERAAPLRHEAERQRQVVVADQLGVAMNEDVRGIEAVLAADAPVRLARRCARRAPRARGRESPAARPRRAGAGGSARRRRRRRPAPSLPAPGRSGCASCRSRRSAARRRCRTAFRLRRGR